MQNIEVINNNLKLVLLVNDENHVRVDYFGTKDINYLRGEVKWRTFIEVEVSGINHESMGASKQTGTYFGLNAKYVSHVIKENEKGRELVLITATDYLEVATHIQFYTVGDSFTIYNVVKNITKDQLTLEYVSSFYINGLGNEPKMQHDQMYIHKAMNSWHCEAQWKRESFYDAGIYLGNGWGSKKRYALDNVGSWSTKQYLPMFIVENEKKNAFILTQIENNGSWHFEVGDGYEVYYLSACGPEFNDAHWCKKLNNGDTFTSVTASICVGDSFEKVIQEITKVRRTMVRPTLDGKEMPVIFNDYMHALWDTQTTELILPLVDAASEVGCEEFVIDAGWFAKGCDWWDIAGDWQIYEDNFPNGGFKAVIDYIHSKGMKAGIWFEIENMGINSPLAKKFPDDYFVIVNGKRYMKNRRYCLNFDNPKVYKWAMDVVCENIDKLGLDYIKNDYNLEIGVGNEYGYDSLGEGLLAHSRAIIRWLKELSDKYPNLTIENCGSGGCRMDYQMLSVCPIQSTSDQTDYRRYPYLSSAVLTAVTPEQAAVWSYPVSTHIDEPVTDEIVAMNMVNASLGRIHLASYINKLTDFQRQIIKDGLKYIKSINEFKKKALPIFPNGISHFFDKNVAGGLINDKDIVLGVWNTSGEPQEIKVDLSKYDIKEIKVGYPLNLNTEFVYDKDNKQLIYKDTNPYSGRVFEIKLK